MDQQLTQKKLSFLDSDSFSLKNETIQSAHPNLFSPQDDDEGILACHFWQFSSNVQELLDISRLVWKISSAEISETQELESLYQRQKLGLSLHPLKNLSVLDKSLFMLSNDRLEKFICMLGLHLTNKKIYVVENQHREKLQTIFKSEELNKILFSWPIYSTVTNYKCSNEEFLEFIKYFGAFGAEKLFGESTVWKLKKMSYSKPAPLNLKALSEQILEASWINFRYFNSFLRWFA